MARKAIPDATQTAILLKSRRRCCLCFWLKGEDDVKKGQFAHLDGDHENPAEGNLVFLCFDHHDEYDSTTRIAKGLREPEVKKWRDELYKEMTYRFKTIKRHGFELALTRFALMNPADRFKAKFRLKNTGEGSVRSPVIAIQLPANVGGELPDRESVISGGGPYSPRITVPMPDPWKAVEEQSDLFEPGGRITVQGIIGLNPVLMPGHTFDFEALIFAFEEYTEGAVVELNYRVDAEDVASVSGTLKATVTGFEDMIRAMNEE